MPCPPGISCLLLFLPSPFRFEILPLFPLSGPTPKLPLSLTLSSLAVCHCSLHCVLPPSSLHPLHATSAERIHAQSGSTLQPTLLCIRPHDHVTSRHWHRIDSLSKRFRLSSGHTSSRSHHTSSCWSTFPPFAANLFTNKARTCKGATYSKRRPPRSHTWPFGAALTHRNCM